MLFRHPCDLIVHSSALFSSFFNHPFPCRFFFSLFKRNNGSKREGTGNTVRFRRSLRVNRWKSGLLRSRYREPRTASKGISIQRFIFRLYDSSESIRRNSYLIFMRANASQTNPLSGGRDIMAHCSPGKPPFKPLRIRITKSERIPSWNTASSVSVLAIVFDRLSERWTVVAMEGKEVKGREEGFLDP